MSIRRPTLEFYLNALEAMYIFERVEAWTKTDYKRVSKRSKLFFSDCGLMSSILNWKMDQIRLNSDRSGKIVETFVHNELATQVDVYGTDYQLYHYRDREKREIDFVIEREDGALLAIEAKAGGSLKKMHFGHMEWFRDNIAADKPFIGIVLYSGSKVIPFGPNLWGVPLGTLCS